MVENNTVGLVVIGDEILKGQIVDTNTSYLAQRLRVYGLKLSRVTVIPDNVSVVKIFLFAIRIEKDNFFSNNLRKLQLFFHIL